MANWGIVELQNLEVYQLQKYQVRHMVSFQDIKLSLWLVDKMAVGKMVSNHNDNMPNWLYGNMPKH
jgi:hypothetical protein